MVNRIVVGAHYGLRDWLVQRISAVVMVVYTLIIGVYLLARFPLDFEGWRVLFAPQWMRVFTLLFLTSLLWHAWIGTRDILMDYIKPTGVRLTSMILVLLALIAYALWSILILWRA